MRTVKLVDGSRETSVSLLNNSRMKLFSSPAAIRLIKMFETPNYVSKAAAKLGLSKQLAAIHVKRLVDAGLLKEVGEVEVRGGRAKLYQTTSSGVAAVYSSHSWRKQTDPVQIPEKLREFLNPLITDGQLNGLIVVGSPNPHGPYRAVATDGHYGFELGLLLGKYVETPKEFSVRLDVDVKSERLYTTNLLLIGGPGTNIITSMVNKELPAKFMENNYWAGIVSPNQVYTSEFTGLVAKIGNPLAAEKTVLVLAGLRAAGTKAAVISVTRFWRKLLNNYSGQRRWAAVVEGIDLDGDGKIDSVEILETAT